MKRMERDFYPTEQKLTQILIDKHLKYETIDTILEPCCGEDHITRVLHSNFYNTAATDITMGEQYDATTDDYWRNRKGKYDWVVTNPPYNKANIIVPKAYDAARVGVAMLLRLTWLEPTKARQEFLQKVPLSTLLIFNPRPKFRSDTSGTDSVTSAWFVWDKETNNRNTYIEYITNWR